MAPGNPTTLPPKVRQLPQAKKEENCNNLITRNGRKNNLMRRRKINSWRKKYENEKKQWQAATALQKHPASCKKRENKLGLSCAKLSTNSSYSV